MYQDWADDLRGKQDDDLAEETEVMVYNPSGLNFAIEDHFAELQLNLPIAIGGRVMSPHMQLCPAHLDESSPHGLLYLAAYANRPELHVPVVKRKRLEKGQHVHHALGKALAMLQSNPSIRCWMANYFLHPQERSSRVCQAAGIATVHLLQDCFLAVPRRVLSADGCRAR